MKERKQILRHRLTKTHLESLVSFPQHKADHKEKRRGKHVQWSPYGCQYYPALSHQDLAVPNIDSLPSDPLGKGEQYFIDLAGNIKKVSLHYAFAVFMKVFHSSLESFG